MPHIVLATEDELSEVVAQVLALEAGFDTMQSIRKGGFGYLKSNMARFCNLAHTFPVLLLADLDRKVCPAILVKEWLGRNSAPQNLLFRVVVREIEAWLLADHIAMRSLLGAGAGALPRDPDALPDPKRSLLALAAGASRAVRSELVAEDGAVASQGIGYNAMLTQLVRERWSPQRASELSPSLAKARARFAELAKRIL